MRTLIGTATGRRLPAVSPWLYASFWAALLATALLLLALETARAQGFRTLREPNFKFSIQIPEDWQVGLTQRKDYRISGPDGSEAANATIIIQIILKSANPDSSALDQLKQLLGKFQSAVNAQFIRDGTAEIAGAQSPFFIISYTTENVQGQKEPFRHIQVALDHGEHYFLLSYSAPDRLFDEYIKVFQHFSATFAFDSAAAPPPAGPRQAAPGGQPAGSGAAGISGIPGRPAGASGQGAGIPSGAVAPPATQPPAVQPAPESTAATDRWHHNEEFNYWIVVPAGWLVDDDRQTNTLHLTHPKQPMGVLVWALDLKRKVAAGEWADTWQEKTSAHFFFMKKRLRLEPFRHPGTGNVAAVPLLRAYEGTSEGITVRADGVYATLGNVAYAAIGYYMAGQTEQERVVHESLKSFRLASPQLSTR